MGWKTNPQINDNENSYRSTTLRSGVEVGCIVGCAEWGMCQRSRNDEKRQETTGVAHSVHNIKMITDD